MPINVLIASQWKDAASDYHTVLYAISVSTIRSKAPCEM
jgi:hypothetical protein